MWKRIALGTLILVLVLGAVAWFNRVAIILLLAERASAMDVAENRPVQWMQGPDKAPASTEDRPPNVIVILVDDLGINDLPAFGQGVAGGVVPTPNIDRLAAEGAVLSNAYAGGATCAPSRGILMTGRYPSRTGYEFTPTPPNMAQVISLIAPKAEGLENPPKFEWNDEFSQSGIGYAEMGLPSDEVTIAEVLANKDYHSVHIGKWHLGQTEEFRAVSQGFDESLLMASGLYIPEDHPGAVNARVDTDTFDKVMWAQMKFSADYDRAGVDTTNDYFKPTGYITDYYTDEAVKVIEANKNRPFFLYLAHWGPHNPLQATKADYDAVGDIGPHRLRVYAAMIRSLDRSVGRVMQKLEDEGIADNTVIVFSSDNGGADYIGLPGINSPYRGWKSTFFEGGIRVPLIVKWPRKIAPGTVIDQPAGHLDLLPTLASIVGAPLPQDKAIDGRDLSPLLFGRGSDFTRPNDALYWFTGFYKVVRAGNWKLHVNERQGKSWLFNLADDPTEQRNLADREPEKRKELEALIQAHEASARKPLYPNSMSYPVFLDKAGGDPKTDDDEYVIWAN